MTAEPPDWPHVTDLVMSGNALTKLLYLGMAVALIYVCRKSVVIARGGAAPAAWKMAGFSFVPLFLASVGAFHFFGVIREIYFTEGLVDPWALPLTTHQGCLMLAAGWGASAVSLAFTYTTKRKLANGRMR